PVDAVRLYQPVDRSGGHRSLFHIDACKPGEHKLLKVIEHSELVYVGNKISSNVPVYPDQLASCLVNEWAANVTEGNKGGPGILVCASDEPRAEELAAAHARQQSWADAICTRAEIDWINGRKANIDAIQREAAVWLGRANDYDWVSDRGMARMQTCPM